MKSAFLLLVAVVLSSSAQEVQVVDRGPHHQVLNRITSFLDEHGKAFSRTNRITELANSLCFLPDGPDAQWQLTREEFQAFENGFVADQGPMRVILADNVNTANAIDLVTSDGKRFEISPVLLAMRDGTGQSVLISEIQDSRGQLIAPNVVLYDNAFPGAAIRISYSREGIEQDCIIFDDTDLHPEAYGLIAASTTIELWSEFLSPPDSTVFPVFEDGVAKDVVVDFGSSRIAAGKAFTTDNQDISVPVRKAYGDVDNRKFLVEKVEYSKVKPFLDQLNPNGAKVGKNPRVQRMAKREVVKGDRELLAQLSGKAKLKRTASIGKPKDETLMAFDWKSNPGFCIDFQLLNTTNITGMTFQGDSTYHIAGTVTLSGTTTFEAGAVLKYTNAAKVKITGPVSWLGSTWRPVVLTAIDDVSVGETVRANTLTGQYADVALDFDANTAAADFTLQNVRISHATNAIRILGRSGHSISHAQFVNCAKAISLTNATSAVRNGLFYNFGTSFLGSNSTVRCEHLTLDAGTTLNSSTNFTLLLTNSLLTAVTTTTGYSGSGVTVLASATGVYQTAGAGAHYLADGSSYRNSGITGINSTLSSDFKNLTTFPPVVISPGQLTAGVVSYSRTVERDTDTPDLGYHYSVADYAVSGLYATNGTTILVNPGVVIAGYRASGSDNYMFWVDYGAKLKVQGTPSSPCRLVWYNAVQEQASTAWQGDVGALVTRQTVFGTASSAEISFRFGEISTLGNSSVPVLSGTGLDTTALAISLRDSVVSGGTIAVDFHLINFTNCLFERVYSVLQGDVSDASRRANFKNCLLYGGALTTYDAGSSLVSVRDTILYQTLLDTGGGTWDNGWNAYQTNGCINCFVLSGSLSTPVINTNLTFLSGSLGRYYLPTSSILVNNGSSANASLVGFYHYTTDTNQVKETTTGLDIGWHYVATASSTSIVPADGDNDGIPDVVEDLDNDGLVDSGETNWQGTADLGFAVRITEPKSSANVP